MKVEFLVCCGYIPVTRDEVILISVGILPMSSSDYILQPNCIIVEDVLNVSSSVHWMRSGSEKVYSVLFCVSDSFFCA